MDNDTPESRLEAFALAMEQADMNLIPPAYNSPTPDAYVADLRAVLARLKAAEHE